MKIAAVAGTTLREVLRRKVQVNLLIFGVLLISATFLVSELTLGEMRRIVTDLGLSATELIGTLLAVFLGSGLIAGEIDRRVLYAVVAKPISRTQYLLGRYLGLAIALVLNLAVMSAVLCAVLYVANDALTPALTPQLFAAIGMQALQFLVVAAVAVLFSSFTTQTLAAIFTLSIALAGHLSNDVRSLSGAGSLLPRIIWYALPNLESLSFNAQVLYSAPLAASTWLPALYGVLYGALALAVAALVFERRNFQ